MKMSKKMWATMALSVLMLSACGSSSKDDKAATKDEKSEVKTETTVATDSLTPFVSEEGKFSINFPGKPKVKVEDIGGEDMTLNMTTYAYEPNDTDGFAVSYTDVSTDVIAKEDARSYLKEEQNGLFESTGIKAADEEKDVDYEGKYPGLRYKAHTGEMYIVSQTYLVGSRLYQVEMLKSGAYPTDDEINKFTGTFKILK